MTRDILLYRAAGSRLLPGPTIIERLHRRIQMLYFNGAGSPVSAAIPHCQAGMESTGRDCATSSNRLERTARVGKNCK